MQNTIDILPITILKKWDIQKKRVIFIAQTVVRKGACPDRYRGIRTRRCYLLRFEQRKNSTMLLRAGG